MRHSESYRRRGPQREPYDSVLIVCEGEKTEPQYLDGLKRAFKLSSANIRVTPADGTDPVSIVRFAERLANKDGGYDRVYCVIDRDGHANFPEAIGLIRQLGYYPIISWPCFEIWVLLHFVYSTAPYNRTGAQSACDLVVREVRKHFAGYSKAHRDIYNHLETKIETALTHAVRLAQHNTSSNSFNPSTAMHELVDYLRKLKR
jgi:RloB-like protein